MDVIEYLEKNDILWEPIRIILDENGKKKTDPFRDFTPKSNDHEKINIDEIKKRQQTKEPYDYIAIFTNSINQYDVDIDGYKNKIFNDAPYFKSIKKRLNHYFIKVENTSKCSYEVRGGDLLCGTWSFCKKNEKVYNYENEIKTYNINEIPKREQKTIKNIVKDLSILDFSRNEWINLCFAIYNSAYEDMIENPKQLLYDFSSKSDKYDDKAKQDIDNIKYEPDGKKIATLIDVHKQYFPDKYEKIEKKQEIKQENKKNDNVIIEDDAEIVKENTKYIVNYNNWKSKWEEYIFIIVSTNKVCYDYYVKKNNKIGITDIICEDFAEGKKYFLSNPDLDYLRECFCKKEKTMKVKVGRQTVETTEIIEYPCIIEWNKDKNRRKYTNYSFSPPGSKNYGSIEYYNLFVGFHLDKYELSKEYDKQTKNDIIESYIDLIKHLTDSDEKCVNYMIQYYADIIQNAGRKPGVCIVLEGTQGSGKGTLDRIDESLFGGYFSQTSDIETIFGRFNSGLANKLLISIDEADPKTLWAKNSPIKNLITEPTVKIEIKHKDSYTEENFLRLKISSNNNGVVSLSDSNERRIFYIGSDKIFIPSNSKININEIISNKDYCKIIFEFLKSVKIEYNNMEEWQKNRPITKKYLEIKEKCVNGIVRCLNNFVLEFVENEERLKTNDTNYEIKDQINIQSRILYSSYLENFAGKQGQDMPFNIFCKKINTFGGITGCRKYNKELDKREQFLNININEYISYVKKEKLGTNELFY